MKELQANKAERNAAVEIESQEELNSLLSCVNTLVANQDKKLNRYKISNIVAPKEELTRTERYKQLLTLLKAGPIKLGVNNIIDLETAINEEWTKYEREVTDNPEDKTIKDFRKTKKLLHKIARKEILSRA